MNKQKLLAIAETFNPERECLDLDLDQIPLGWDDISLFIKEEKMTIQGFCEYFMGGMITRETANRLLVSKKQISRNHKFFFIYALKHRMNWIEHSRRKNGKDKCEHCGK